jgi:hypothetical protein
MYWREEQNFNLGEKHCFVKTAQNYEIKIRRLNCKGYKIDVNEMEIL